MVDDAPSLQGDVLDLRVPRTATIGVSADLRYLYASGHPGNTHARPCPVIITAEGIAHLSAHDATRVGWLQARIHFIVRAIESPAVVYRDLEYKSRIGHWSQFYAVRDTLGSSQYVAVAVTLANLVGGEARQFHRVTTIFAAKESYLFKKVAGVPELKPQWMYVTKKGVGTKPT